MKILRRSLLLFCPALFLFTSFFTLFPVVPACALSVNSLGDYDNIAVMEISGDYSAVNASGEPNLLPRQVVSQEFYRQHGDDYDFLVIFTNFDFLMPAAGAKAFFVPVKNHIEGLGLDLYDATHLYSADGAFLSRLDGLIDMANIAGHVLEPTDPAFEKTLLTLTHEMLHRWGAYLSFTDDGEMSDSLLGLGNAHWSFLLDAQGSSLYGNHWQDNGDGTFTSIVPEQSQSNSPLGRVFSPLELYLMGLADWQQVPPLTLIDSPGTDRNRLPEVGVTISGIASTVTIEQIISATGARVPAAAPEKGWRMGFLLLVTPGSWSSDDAESLRQLSLLRNLQREWQKRFSILTDGDALLQTALVEADEFADNPGVLPDTSSVHVAPHISEAVNWLLANQSPGGFWQDQTETVQRDTAAAVTALKLFPVGLASAGSGQSWLGGVNAENNDFLARKYLGLENVEVSEVENRQNTDGGWGSAPGYCSNPLDSALALKALTTHRSTNTTVINQAITYLHAAQAADGGWSTGAGGSMIQPAAWALLALDDYRDNPDYTLEPTFADGAAWLAARQNVDGGFGNSLSTVYDTASAISALRAAYDSPLATASAVSYLLKTQSINGSWHNSAFQTAMAVQALHAGTIQTDLQVQAADLSAHPLPVFSLPADIIFSAQVWNHGEATVAAVKVVLYQGEPALGVIAGEAEVSIPGHSFINIDFPVHLATSGEVEYFVQVDPDDLVAEVSNRNNLASMAFHAGVPPTVGFDLASSNGLESVSSVALVVSLSHIWDQTVSIDLSVDSSSTATSPSDYLVTAGSLVFLPGEMRKNVVVQIVNDLLPENDETVVLVLSNPENATLSQAQTIYHIVNDDVPPVVGFAVSNGSGSETVAAVSVAVALSHAYPQDVTVDFAIDGAASGATTGEDVLLAAGTLVIRAGETAKSIEMSVVNDTVEESDESVVIRLSNPQVAILGSSIFTYTILDNDAAPLVAISEPVNNTIYTSGPFVLQYQTNMPAEQITVYLNEVAVPTRAGQPLPIQGNGQYTVRVVATNGTHLSTEALVHFEIDESGQSPTLVWQNLLQGEWAGGKTYNFLQYSADGAVYAVRNTETGSPIVTKFDQSGHILWEQTVPENTSSYNNCKDSAMTADAYVILDTTSIRWFSDAATAAGVLSHNAALPAYVDSSWSKFAMDSADNYYLAGPTVEGITKADSADGGNIQLAKMDVANNVLWRRVIATKLTDSASDVVADSVGNVYLSGTTGGYFGLSGGSSAGEEDIFLIKLDSDGNELWRRQWGTPLADSSSQLALDSQGNVLLVGATFATFDGVGPTYDQDALIIKVAPDGTELWLRQDHGISGGQVVTLSPEDDVVIAGWSGRKRSNYIVNLDVAWSRYTAEGDYVWTDAVSTGSLSYNESAVGLVSDPSGNLFVSASYLYENYSTNRWESRGFLSKYRTGTDFSPPLLTVLPHAYDPVERTLVLSGRHEYLAGLSVQVDTSASVATSTSLSSVDWSSTITDLYPGPHTITIVATDADGMVSRKEIVLDIVPSTPFALGATEQYGTANQDIPNASVVSDQDQLYFAGYEGTADGLYKDVTIWKTDVSGGMTTFARIDMAAEEQGKKITLDANGFVYMAWDSASKAYVGKFDVAGKQLWVSEYGSRKGGQNVEAVGVDRSGNVFIAGRTINSPDRNVAHGGGQDYFLTKFNSNGVYQWSRLSGIGHPGDQAAYGLGIDSAGNVYLAGCSQGAIHGVSSANSAFIAKFDNDGNLRWVDVIKDNRPGVIKDLVVDEFDAVYVLGEVDYLTGRKQDIFLAKYDPAGAMSWFETFGGDYNDYARDISLDRHGNVLITGLMNMLPFMSGLKNDIFWAKYDAAGHRMWAGSFDALTSDDAIGIHKTSQGSILITGRTSRLLGSASYGRYDMFVRELKPLSGPALNVDPVLTPTSSQTITLFGQVSQGAEVAIVIDAPVGSTAIVSAVTVNPVTGIWSCQVTNLAPNQDNVLTVFASDSYGSSRQSVTVAVDTLPPGLSVDAVASTTGLPKLLLSGTVESGAGLTVAVNPPAPSVTIAETSGFWTYTADLVEGDNVITLMATDDVGNIAEKTVTTTRLPSSPPSIDVSPAMLPQGEHADVTLAISNPNGFGSSVYVSMLYDVTGDGLSPDDLSVRKFFLADGIPSSDPNVPGDEDGAENGRLTSTLNFQYIYDLQKAPGQYLFTVSIDGNPLSAPFVVSETNQAQTIHGYVFDDVKNPIVGARVQLFDKSGHSYGYAYSDVAGHYVFNVMHPGEYYLIPTSRDYAYGKSEIVVETLGAGQNLTADLSMVPGSASFLGWLKDSSTSEVITGGNYVRAENDLYIAEAYDLAYIITTTDNAFRYRINLPPGDYGLYVDTFNSRGGFAQGYLGVEGPLAQTPPGLQDFSLEKVAGVVCGRVADQAMMGVAGVVLLARPDSGTGQFATAITDARGDYCIGLADTGSWQVSLNDKANQATGYVGNYLDGLTINAGPLSGNDLTVFAIDAWLQGSVLAEDLRPIADALIKLVNMTTGTMVRGKTAFDGSYRLGAFAGDWTVELLPVDSGYVSVNPVPVALVASQTATQDFTVALQSEPLFVDVTVQSPTGQSTQKIGGNCSENAAVTVVADTGANVGPVVSLTSTTWECTITNLQEGTNTVSVTVSNGVTSYQAPDVTIDYQPVQQANTIAITNATYTTRKNTLVVDASSNYPNAALVIEYSGTSVPMNFVRLLKGKYLWSFIDASVGTVPGSVTVVGPEGSTVKAVVKK